MILMEREGARPARILAHARKTSDDFIELSNQAFVLGGRQLSPMAWSFSLACGLSGALLDQISRGRLCMHLTEEGTCSTYREYRCDCDRYAFRRCERAQSDNNESMHCFKFFESTSTRPSNDKIMSVLNSKSLPPWRKCIPGPKMLRDRHCDQRDRSQDQEGPGDPHNDSRCACTCIEVRAAVHFGIVIQSSLARNVCFYAFRKLRLSQNFSLSPLSRGFQYYDTECLNDGCIRHEIVQSDLGIVL